MLPLTTRTTTPPALILHAPGGDEPAALAYWPCTGRSTTALPYGVRYLGNTYRLHKAHRRFEWWINAGTGRGPCTLLEANIPHATLTQCRREQQKP